MNMLTSILVFIIAPALVAMAILAARSYFDQPRKWKHWRAKTASAQSTKCGLWIGDRNDESLGGFYAPQSFVYGRRGYSHPDRNGVVFWSVAAQRWEVRNGDDVLLWKSPEDVNEPWNVGHWLPVGSPKAPLVLVREDCVTAAED